MKKTVLTIGVASLIAVLPIVTQAQEVVYEPVNDTPVSVSHIEPPLINKGDRINERLDRKGDRIERRWDRRQNRVQQRL